MQLNRGLLGNPCVSLIKDDMHIEWDPYVAPYPGLRFKSNGLNTVSLKNNEGNTPDLKYSLDGGSTWTQWDYSAISLNEGDEICFKGNNPNGFSLSQSKSSRFEFSSSSTVEASGNIMSLIDDGACETLVIPNNYCFYYLLGSCYYLITAPELPATTLTRSCYMQMFYYCTSLITPPKLPATTLTRSCYNQMFSDCTSLTEAPELPATTLADNCYQSMFSKCTSLTKAPELPATTLAVSCYYSMFTGCTSLTQAPELPAITLVQRCYNEMFSNCTSLTSLTCKATDISASECIKNWLFEILTTGTLYVDPSMTGSSWNKPSSWSIQAIQ